MLMLDPDEATSLQKPISTVEITVAIQSMQSEKSPGPEGYPSDFVKKCSSQLILLFMSVSNNATSSNLSDL